MEGRLVRKAFLAGRRTRGQGAISQRCLRRRNKWRLETRMARSGNQGGRGSGGIMVAHGVGVKDTEGTTDTMWFGSYGGYSLCGGFLEEYGGVGGDGGSSGGNGHIRSSGIGGYGGDLCGDIEGTAGTSV